MKQLVAMKDDQFENLTFDLMVYSGLRNTTWRTPGADGGRDIEGIWLQSDPAMQVRQESWYVECKRYKNSVGWPTIFEKVAYAANADADILLLVTSAALTPNCKTEITKWNGRKQRPAIQFLDGSRLAARLSAFPALLAKYGLAEPSVGGRAIRGVLGALVSACDAAEGDLDEKFDSIGAVAAFELARIVRIRSEEVELYGKFSIGATRKATIPAWCENSTKLTEVPSAIRAYLSYFRFVVRPRSIHLVLSLGNKYELEVLGATYSTAIPRLDEVAIWCGVTAMFDGSKLSLEVAYVL